MVAIDASQLPMLAAHLQSYQMQSPENQRIKNSDRDTTLQPRPIADGVMQPTAYQKVCVSLAIS